MSEPTKARRAAAGRAATKKELPEHFKAYKHVWVFIEQERGQVHPVSWELMGAGRKLADKLRVDLAARGDRPGGRGDPARRRGGLLLRRRSRLRGRRRRARPTTATSPTPRR